MLLMVSQDEPKSFSVAFSLVIGRGDFPGLLVFSF